MHCFILFHHRKFRAIMIVCVSVCLCVTCVPWPAHFFSSMIWCSFRTHTQTSRYSRDLDMVQQCNTYLKTGNEVSVKRLACFHCCRPVPSNLVDSFDRLSCPNRPRPSFATTPLHYNIPSLGWIAAAAADIVAVAVAAVLAIALV